MHDKDESHLHEFDTFPPYVWWMILSSYRCDLTLKGPFLPWAAVTLSKVCKCPTYKAKAQTFFHLPGLNQISPTITLLYKGSFPSHLGACYIEMNKD
jgi:uncharacterized membrane protein